MAKKSPKPRPMKSIKNGLKDRKLIEENIRVIKSIENYLKNQ
jgi:hypothetical protein